MVTQPPFGRRPHGMLRQESYKPALQLKPLNSVVHLKAGEAEVVPHVFANNAFGFPVRAAVRDFPFQQPRVQRVLAPQQS